MTVGASAPRYQNMAVLYPQSAALQSHLCEYYIVVVRICHKLVKTLKTTVWRQMGSFLSASEMSGFQSDLDRWATSIKDEVTILTAQSINEQAADLRLVTWDWAEEKRRRELKDYYCLLDRCSTYDYQTSWKVLRKIGSTSLFNSLTTYRAWKAALRTPSSTLVCLGKLGSGKSVWLANMIDDLYLTARGDKQSLGYFFCRHDVSESLNARVVIGSITRQLLQQCKQGAQFDASRELYRSLGDLKDLVNLLETVVPPSHVIHLVIDGLDECSDSEQDKVLQTLENLQTIRIIHVCLSFRLAADSSIRLNMESIPNCATASIPEDNPDIGYFIDAELQRCLETRRLTLGNPILISRIQDALLRGAQGMFLWVALQITSLCASRTDKDIEDALDNLPVDLSETFSRILQRSRETDYDDLQTRILGFIITARRPLTTSELREALAVVPGDISWNPGRLINNMYAALGCCGCLITVDEEDLTIRLVHHSAKTYLTGGSIAPVPIQAANSAMADVVITYLNYGVFDKQVSTMVTPRVPGGQVISNIASSFDPDIVRRMALNILKSRKGADVDVGNVLRETIGKPKYDDAQSYEFYNYAKSYLAEHLVYSSSRNEGVVLLLSKLLAKPENRLAVSPLMRSEGHNELLHALIVTGLDVEVEDEVNGATPLIWAASRGNVPIVSELIKKSANLEAAVKKGRFNGFYPPYDRQIPKLNKGATPLLEAVASGHEEIVRNLIENGAELGVSDEQRYSPLMRAIQAGAKSTIKMLLEFAGDRARHIWEVPPDITRNELDDGSLEPHEVALSRRFPLQMAVSLGDEDTVSQLVEKGFRIRGWKDRGIESPLSLAVVKADLSMMKLLVVKGADMVEADSVRFPWHAPEREKIAVVKLLVENGAKVGGSSSIFGADVLARAAQNGDVALVELLLENGANVDDLDQFIGTPLAAAAGEGHKAVVRLLLDRGANTETTPSFDKYGTRRPLMKAIYRGQEGTVEILCEGGADLEAKSSSGLTALMLAVDTRNEKMVKLLLDSGANTETAAGGKTPLSLAAIKQDEQIARILLTGGANIEAKCPNDWTPLYQAARDGHVEMVRILIEHGAELNSRSAGFTALMIAAENGERAVVDELLKAGANPNIREDEVPFPIADHFSEIEEIRELFRYHGL